MKLKEEVSRAIVVQEGRERKIGGLGCGNKVTGDCVRTLACRKIGRKPGAPVGTHPFLEILGIVVISGRVACDLGILTEGRREL